MKAVRLLSQSGISQSLPRSTPIARITVSTIRRIHTISSTCAPRRFNNTYSSQQASLPRSKPFVMSSSSNSTAFPPLQPTSTSSDAKSSPEKKPLRYIDIGINLTDPIFRGIHHGKQSHDDDFEDVLQRALDIGCQKFMVTGSDLKESGQAVQLAKEHSGIIYATIGVHPCSAKQIHEHPDGPDTYLSFLSTLALSAKSSGHAVAFGEIGLDYDRLYLCPKEVQLEYFEAQLDIAVKVGLPLFLHSRAAAQDFERLLKSRLDGLPKRGLVHSFTGTAEEMRALVALGFDVGVNGCSMKTEENCAVVREIPLERLQIETDGPWCEMRPSHASAKYLADAAALPKSVKKEKWVKGAMVKGRNEPCAIGRVAWAIAGIKEVDVSVVAEAAWNNSVRMFGLGETVEEVKE